MALGGESNELIPRKLVPSKPLISKTRTFYAQQVLQEGVIILSGLQALL